MSGYGPLTLGLMIALLAVFTILILLATGRNRRGQTPTLRPIAGYKVARNASARAAESGRPLHLAPGPGAVGASGVTTAETLAGLALVEPLSRQAALTGAPLLTTTGDTLTLPLTENVVRQGYAAAGRQGEAPLMGAIAARTVEGHAQGVRLLAHRDRLAYAAAAGDLIEHAGPMQSVVSGGFGPEYLLIGEAQARAGVPVVAGATDRQALATMLIAADQTLIGEEIYAAGAYLGHQPAHLASLQAQDVVRWLIILLILVGAGLATALGSDNLANLFRLTNP